VGRLSIIMAKSDPTLLATQQSAAIEDLAQTMGVDINEESEEVLARLGISGEMVSIAQAARPRLSEIRERGQALGLIERGKLGMSAVKRALDKFWDRRL
jgi:hypothetical protein